MSIKEYKKAIEQRSEQLYFSNFKKKKSSRRWYQHDIDMIIYSDMFRKMQRKSQLLSIQDPVSRSRLIHTFEVVRIAKEISEKLGLNTELTEAIALSHDFGNVTYGKTADDFLKNQTNNTFRHEEVSSLMLKIASIRLIPEKYREKAKEAIQSNERTTHTIEISEFPYFLEVLKNKTSIQYICISPEVLDGVVKHGTEETAFTLEGQVVNYADNIAYLIQDISDFEATGIFDKDARQRYSNCLDSIIKEDKNKEYPLIGIVGNTTSERTATLIERFVQYNSQRLKNKSYDTTFSPILNMDIPILQIEPLLKEAIDCCWNFKKEFYDYNLIKISNISSSERMQQLWGILERDSDFVNKNSSYMNFMKLLDCPVFETFKNEKKFSIEDWENWKKAYFIAHLTCDEVDFVVKSFLERDYVFDLSLPKI